MLTTALLLVALVPAQLTAEKPPQAPPKPPSAPQAEKPAQPAAKPPQAPAAARPAPPRPTTITIAVTDRQGQPLSNVAVKATGPMEREGETDAEGTVLLRNVSAGTYRLRFEHKTSITFEREVVVQSGRPLRTTAELSAAPPPPAPPPPPPAPVAPPPPARPSGPPTSVDIPDVAEKSSKSAQVGCTGTSTSTLVQVKDPLPAHAHGDADELIYVVAGTGTQRIGGVDLNLTAGTFAVVPRGTQHSIARRGSRPLILLSIVTGPPCEAGK